MHFRTLFLAALLAFACADETSSEIKSSETKSGETLKVAESGYGGTQDNYNGPPAQVKEQPQQQSYEQPQQSYEQPQQKAYEQPAQSPYQQPQQPAYQAQVPKPAQTYSAPETTNGYGQNSYAPQGQQSYEQQPQQQEYANDQQYEQPQQQQQYDAYDQNGNNYNAPQNNYGGQQNEYAQQNYGGEQGQQSYEDNSGANNYGDASGYGYGAPASGYSQPETNEYKQGAQEPAQISYGGFQPIGASQYGKQSGYTKPLVLEIVNRPQQAYQPAPQPQPQQQNSYQPNNYEQITQEQAYASAGGYSQPDPTPDVQYQGLGQQAYGPAPGYGQPQAQDISYKKPNQQPQQYPNAGYNLDYGTGKPYAGDFTRKPVSTQFSANAGPYGQSNENGYDVSVPFDFASLGLGNGNGYENANLNFGSSLYGSSSNLPQGYGSSEYGALGGEGLLGGYGGESYKSASSLIPKFVKAPFKSIYQALTRNRIGFLG